MLIVITMEVKITNSWLFREYLSAINENLGILATIFIAISRGLVAIKARFLVRDITREQRRFGGFLAPVSLGETVWSAPDFKVLQL